MAYEADRLKLHKHKAAENIALLATCKAQEINPREYLNGTPSGIRTLDPLIKSQLLYQLS